MLAELRDCVFGYRDRRVVQVDHLELHSSRSTGLFGPNGSGKTTLVRGIAGLIEPIEGVIERDGQLRFGYLPQQRGMDQQWPMTAMDAASMAISAYCALGWTSRRRHLLDPILQALEVEDISHNVEDIMAMSTEIAWVHLSEEPDRPNRVEIIAPSSLAERILEARQTA